MFIAKVIGNVVSTQKIAKFRGMKLLLIQPYISKEGKLQISGGSVVAVDSVGAGKGECVLFTPGRKGHRRAGCGCGSAGSARNGIAVWRNR
jgi:ethanolamine utilization protein EutN